MPFFFDQGSGRTVCCLFCLHASLLFSSIAAAQSSGSGPLDTTCTSKRPHYFSITVLSGSAVQFFPNRNGLFSVSFPYTVADAFGSTVDTFSARQRNVFGSARVFVGPLAVEMGWLHAFIHGEFSFLLGKGIGAPGWRASIGYGRIYSVGRYAIKCSLNLATTAEPRQAGDQLGSIDMQHKTIYLFGGEMPSTFMSSNQPIAANTLVITYSQREWSLLPKVSILPNPYRKPNHFELSVGYNLSFSDVGSMNFVEQGSSTSQGTESQLIGGPNLLSRGISASYNNRPLKAALYSYRGFYLEVRYDVIDWKDKKKTRT
ncbi:MAG TPA: hypothetical protein VNU72_04275 [Puia sp.]|jgi:hypothetical protein|nr:hypothetical protein [Puia sp.]